MNGNTRNIGWILIGIGALAGAFLLGRITDRPVPWTYGYGMPQPGYGQQVMPGQGWRQPEQAPQQQMPPQSAMPGHGAQGMYDRGMGHHGMGGWFFLPFMLLGGLLKFLFFGLLFLALLKFVRGGRGHWGGPWGGWGRKHGCRHHEHDERDERDDPRREAPRRDEPNTGATVSL